MLQRHRDMRNRLPAAALQLDTTQVLACSQFENLLQPEQRRTDMNTRTERDFLGERVIPADAYYGVQTQRGMDNFRITGVPMSAEPEFVRAFGFVKKAAALANRDLGVLDAAIANAIVAGCDKLIAGEMREQFLTDFIQGGAGTSTNMNANEVIANLALEHLGHAKGEYQFVNPNDHVNYGQSTNDIYPTAFRLALILRLTRYMESLTKLQASFFAKAVEFDRVLKMGRTHLQDAVPMSLGQEFHGWGTTIGEEVQRIAEVRQFLHEINLGATAIGTMVTAAPGYPELATRYLSELTGTQFILAGDLVEATSDTGAYVLLSGVLKRTSSKLTKICNDLRLLASGPRCGFNEIHLPQMQPGSSIMPGKVNPVIPEVVNQVSFLVIGLDLTVTLAASAGQLQLNVMEPVITFALFTSISTMENAVNSLRVNCIDGITANAERTRDMVLNSLGIVTVLKPHFGYKQCAEIAREGYETGKSLHDIVVNERKLLTQQKWDEIFSFENLINPQFER
jgi:aspartate ammonia-lyase